MTENGSEEGLLVRAEPLGLAEDISQRMVDVVRVVNGALLLDADPEWARAIRILRGLCERGDAGNPSSDSRLAGCFGCPRLRGVRSPRDAAPSGQHIPLPGVRV